MEHGNFWFMKQNLNLFSVRLEIKRFQEHHFSLQAFAVTLAKKKFSLTHDLSAKIVLLLYICVYYPVHM